MQELDQLFLSECEWAGSQYPIQPHPSNHIYDHGATYIISECELGATKEVSKEGPNPIQSTLSNIISESELGAAREVSNTQPNPNPSKYQSVSWEPWGRFPKRDPTQPNPTHKWSKYQRVSWDPPGRFPKREVGCFPSRATAKAIRTPTWNFWKCSAFKTLIICSWPHLVHLCRAGLQPIQGDLSTSPSKPLQNLETPIVFQIWQIKVLSPSACSPLHLSPC